MHCNRYKKLNIDVPSKSRQVTDKIYHIMLGRVQKDITQIFIDICLTSSDKSFHTYAGHEQVMIYLENYTAMKEPTGSTTFDFYWERLYSAFCNGYNASSFFQIYDVVFNMQCTWFSPNTLINIKFV
jgi:hypothetical protein